MTFSTNKQSFIAATAFILLAALVLFEPLPEPRLTILKSILFWPAALWLAWFAWTRRSERNTTANTGGVIRPLIIVAFIAAILAAARWATLAIGGAS